MNATTLRRLTVAGLVGIARHLSGQQLPPHVRVLGTIPDFTLENLAVLPNGRVAMAAEHNTLVAYNFGTKTRTDISHGRFHNLTVSPKGDRIAWHRPDDRPTAGSQPGASHDSLVWSMPISPETGIATGPAGIVSDLHGHTPRFSPDGGLIAFTSAETHSLVVVPANGGPERRLGSFTADVLPDWSFDGKSLFAKSIDGDSIQSIEQIPLDGGQPRRFLTMPEAREPGGRILSTDGRATLYLPTIPLMRKGHYGDPISYVTASGARGTLALPMPTASTSPWFVSSWNAGASHAQVVIGSNETTTYTLDVGTGAIHQLLPSGTISSRLAWSADGRRLAVQTRRGWQSEITVLDRDGSNRRVYPVSAGGGMDGAMNWSPDGRYIAFTTPPRGAIAVLNLGTGTATTVSSPAGTLGAVVWRRDSKSILIAKNKASLSRPTATDQQIAIYEARLDGSERLVRDIGTEVSGVIGGTWISDTAIVLANRDKRIVVPVDGGAVRTLPGPGFGGTFNSYVSTDGKHLLIRARPKGPGNATVLTVMTTSGDSVRTVNLFTEAEQTPWQRPVLHPSGDFAIYPAAITPGKPNDSTQLYVAPFNGKPQRLLATLPGVAARDQFKLSPDGNTLAFTVVSGPRSMTVLDVDLSPILRNAKH